MLKELFSLNTKLGGACIAKVTKFQLSTVKQIIVGFILESLMML